MGAADGMEKHIVWETDFHRWTHGGFWCSNVSDVSALLDAPVVNKT